MHVGIAGVGRMGAAIAARLLEVGHQVTVWNRTRAKVAPLAAAGAERCQRLFKGCGRPEPRSAAGMRSLRSGMMLTVDRHILQRRRERTRIAWVVSDRAWSAKRC